MAHTMVFYCSNTKQTKIRGLWFITGPELTEGTLKTGQLRMVLPGSGEYWAFSIKTPSSLQPEGIVVAAAGNA